MSGFEVAGVVLGGFPILLNCLDYYRQGFEPLEEWWSFRTSFIAFFDDIRHQMMRYNKNMILLLDPIVKDSVDLVTLVDSPDDPRWKNGSLDGLLQQRLASEADRFIRIINRMNDIMISLYKLLQVVDGQVAWIGTPQDRPWQWQLKRLHISFSKGKHKKVKKLAEHNRELEEFLGYTEHIIPVSERRKASEPVALLEKVRQHAYNIHDTLSRRWTCGSSNSSRDRATAHRAHLRVRAEATSVSLNVLFPLCSTDGDGDAKRAESCEISIAPVRLSTPATSSRDVSVVPQSTVLAVAQNTISKQEDGSKSMMRTFKRELSTFFKKSSTSSTNNPNGNSISNQVPTITVTSVNGQVPMQALLNTRNSVSVNPTLESNGVDHFCAFLGSQERKAINMETDNGQHLEFQKIGTGHVSTPSIELLPLDEILDAHHQTSINVSRQIRFEMASHIASALLQTRQSPWLGGGSWTKRHFYFWTDFRYSKVCNSCPFVPQSFATSLDDNRNHNDNLDGPSWEPAATDEEETRACLFSVGVIILELIFGQRIEDCIFRRVYYGSDGRPNDQTDAATARRWAGKVLGDSGPHISDVVRRCLDCSFGPRPNLGDVRFRESVYGGVIKPLLSYSSLWTDVIPPP